MHLLPITSIMVAALAALAITFAVYHYIAHRQQWQELPEADKKKWRFNYANRPMITLVSALIFLLPGLLFHVHWLIVFGVASITDDLSTYPLFVGCLKPLVIIRTRQKNKYRRAYVRLACFALSIALTVVLFQIGLFANPNHTISHLYKLCITEGAHVYPLTQTILSGMIGVIVAHMVTSVTGKPQQLEKLGMRIGVPLDDFLWYMLGVFFMRHTHLVNFLPKVSAELDLAILFALLVSFTSVYVVNTIMKYSRGTSELPDAAASLSEIQVKALSAHYLFLKDQFTLFPGVRPYTTLVKEVLRSGDISNTGHIPEIKQGIIEAIAKQNLMLEEALSNDLPGWLVNQDRIAKTLSTLKALDRDYKAAFTAKPGG